MLLKSTSLKWIGLFIVVLLMIFCMWASVIFGYTDTSWQLAIDAFKNNNGSNEHLIIQTVRLPRALIVAAAGASLAIAGALMQTLTKIHWRSPSFLGLMPEPDLQ